MKRIKLGQTYNSWNAMVSRCTRESDNRWHYYGARGIKVCDRWLFGDGALNGFECFAIDMGDRPIGMTIDRIDTNGHYEPNNCRWATPKEQAANRRNRRPLAGEMTMREAANKYGLRYTTLRKRIVELGWDMQRAISTPPKPQTPRKRV